MTMVWDRLDQLGHEHRRRQPAPLGAGPPLVVLLDPTVGSLEDVAPVGVATTAPWLHAELRQRLLLRSQRPVHVGELREAVGPGQEVRGATLRVGTLHLGVLVALVPVGGEPPWTHAVVRRIAEGLAALAAPLLAVQLDQAHRRDAAQARLQLELAHLDGASGEVQVARPGGEFAASTHVAGEVGGPGQVAAFLVAVRGDEAAPALATLAAATLRRWLTDLPATDPATVLDAAAIDLSPLLERLHAELDVVVTLRRAPRELEIATTRVGVAICDAGGGDLGLVVGDGRPLGTGVLGQYPSRSVRLPAGGYVFAAAGCADPRLHVRYGVPRRERAATAPAALAARLVDALTVSAPVVLVHQVS